MQKKFEVDNEQDLTFKEGDNGPFWMSDADREKCKEDQQSGDNKQRNKTKVEMLVDLQREGVDTSKRRYLLQELQELCRENSIPLQVTEQNIAPGWLNKPKGLLQILWERGYIDESKVKTPRSMRYSKGGKKEDFDADRNLTEVGKKYSLTYLMNVCSDFRDEKTDLEHLASELSSDTCTFSTLFTPKFHCKLAREGAECSWGAAKRFHRRQPLKDKKSFANFVATVKKPCKQ